MVLVKEKSQLESVFRWRLNWSSLPRSGGGRCSWPWETYKKCRGISIYQRSDHAVGYFEATVRYFFIGSLACNFHTHPPILFNESPPT